MVNGGQSQAGKPYLVCDGIAYSEPSTIKVFVINVIKTASENLGIDNIKIYPNPSNGIFRIEGLKANQQKKLEIYTSEGKLIRQIKGNSIIEMIDIVDRVQG